MITISRSRIYSALAAVLLCPALVAAQGQPSRALTTLSLEELLEIRVVAASKFPQDVMSAPASISIITGDEIRLLGHRTLADVLRSVRGMFATSDRGYEYVGVRGFGRRGDYNSRVLFLLNGSRLNEAAGDQAPVGADFPVDLSLVDRIEVIRGPGSALYGTSAFFAVINVVTHSASNLDGLRVGAEAGGLGTRALRGSFGHEFTHGIGLVAGGTIARRDGLPSIYFPEFDTPETGNGIAHDMDGEDVTTLFASVTRGSFSIRAASLERDKQYPTAAYGTVFGDRRASLRDTRQVAELTYDGSLGSGWRGIARLRYAEFAYLGSHPYRDGDVVGIRNDGGSSRGVGAELTANRQFGRHVLTLGGEGRWDTARLRASGWAGPQFDYERPANVAAGFVQDALTIVEPLVLTAGVRIDHHEAVGVELTPRAGLVYTPRATTAIKLLHGRAFRAPNIYERYYYPLTNDLGIDLMPERIATSEVVWEQRVGNSLRTSLGAFHSRTDGLIGLSIYDDPAGAGGVYFDNLQRTHASGIEGEVEGRWPNGITARASHAFSRVRDTSTGARLSNSPAHVAKVAVILPLLSRRAHVGLEGQYIGTRMTQYHQPLPGFFVDHATLSLAATPRLDFSLHIHNLFDTNYADPGSEEHVQDRIAQDGRTLTLKMKLRL
jgi:outer membrane receptor for ferrienterochelin and colicins